MMVGTPRPSSPTSMAAAPRSPPPPPGVAAVAELVLEALQAERVELAVRRPARQEEAGKPLRRLRQDQESIAHGRRQEPFVAGEAVSLARAAALDRLGARAVAAQ